MLLVLRSGDRLGLGALAAWHGLNLGSLTFDRIVVLDAGKAVADGSPQEMLTRSLVEAVDGVRVRVQQDDGARPYVLLCPSTADTDGGQRTARARCSVLTEVRSGAPTWLMRAVCELSASSLREHSPSVRGGRR